MNMHLLTTLVAIVALAQASPASKADQLHDAARKGDAPAVKKLLDEGVEHAAADCRTVRHGQDAHAATLLRVGTTVTDLSSCGAAHADRYRLHMAWMQDAHDRALLR